MDRRRFLQTSLAGALVVPRVVRAQRTAKPAIGLLALLPENSPVVQRNWQFFRDGLRELGYVEGDGVAFVYRYANGEAARLPALAAELVALKVDVIVGVSTPVALALHNATKTIPVVFAAVGEPVSLGLVASLARPGGNTTGISNVSVTLSAKQLEILKQAVPRASRVAVLVNPHTLPLWLKETEAAASALQIEVQPYRVGDAALLPDAFSAMARAKVDALVVLADVMFLQNRTGIADLAKKARLPTVFPFREHVEVGGLIAYGASIAEQAHRAATYVDRILKGNKPANLPVEQPTKFELIINLKAAKALGLTIPPSLLARADHVIE
jgi:putative ABC transport system substrate-binding protein